MKSVLDGRWTLDTHLSTCGCGQLVYLLRRGRMTRLPRQHQCLYAERQATEVRTIRVIEGVCRITELEAAQRLADAMEPEL